MGKETDFYSHYLIPKSCLLQYNEIESLQWYWFGVGKSSVICIGHGVELATNFIKFEYFTSVS